MLSMLSADSCQYPVNDQLPVETLVLSPANQHEVVEIQQSAPLRSDSNDICVFATVLAVSGKERRACLKRERRKRKRQALAKLRECASADQLAIKQGDDDDDDDEKADDEQSEREHLHQEWLERERIAQEEFRLKREKEEAAQKKKEDEERRIKEEWEEQQRKEQKLQEQKQQDKRDREEAVQKLLDQAESQLENGGYWKNPDAPVDYGTEKDKANCPFFIKTGACRFGERCSRKHEHPSSSTTLIVRGMFVTFAMEQSRRDDYDTDASLEYSEDEMRQQFLDFYDDVVPEFRLAGKVVQFKVSCNFEPHLRGNVYVQYDTEDQCKKAFMMFNGRWYAGRQLQCEFSPVTKWKTAICGLFDRRKCPKGKHCNFLHVFQNPGLAFWEADRDLHLSSDCGGSLSGWHRASSQREHSHHRQGNKRSHSHEKYSHRWSRSRSRERRRRSGSKERRRRSGSKERRRRSGSKERRRRSGSKERRRRSGSKERRSRSGSKERRSRSGSKERRSRSGSKERRSRSRSKERRSRSRSKERRSRSRSKERRRRSRSKERRSTSRSKESRSRSKERRNRKRTKHSRKRAKMHIDK